MLRVGDVLAERYRLDDRIGGGGMGDVWRGEDVVLNRTVAVKVLHAKLAEEDNFRERFRREACAIAALESPNIVDVYDYGEVNTPRGVLAFLVMPYVDARPLSRHLAYNGRLDTTETLDIVAQVADGLDVAHRAGIIHRDVKPGNILVGDNGRVTLVDFGIARTSGDMTMTTAGVVLGTVTYMSPEQASGERLTPASDIYSLGVVAYQCLTGSPPFKADTPLGVLSAHLKEVPPRLPDEIPAPVPDLVVRALAKELDDRWPTADDFADACRSAGSSTRHQAIAPSAPPEVRQARFPGESTTVPRPETASSPNDGPPRRAHRGVLILGVAVLMAVLFATAATTSPTISCPPRPCGRGRADNWSTSTAIPRRALTPTTAPTSSTRTARKPALGTSTYNRRRRSPPHPRRRRPRRRRILLHRRVPAVPPRPSPFPTCGTYPNPKPGRCSTVQASNRRSVTKARGKTIVRSCHSSLNRVNPPNSVR